MVSDGQFAIGDAAGENDRFAIVFDGECAGSDADGQAEIRDFCGNVFQHELAFPLAFDFRRQAGDVVRQLFDAVGRAVQLEIGRVARVLHAEFALQPFRAFDDADDGARDAACAVCIEAAVQSEHCGFFKIQVAA